MQWNINSVPLPYFCRVARYTRTCLDSARSAGVSYVQSLTLERIRLSNISSIKNLRFYGLRALSLCFKRHQLLLVPLERSVLAERCHSGGRRILPYRNSIQFVRHGPGYRSGPLLTDRLHILPLVRRRGYHVPSVGTVDSGCPRRTLRMLRRADCSRAQEEHPQASISNLSTMGTRIPSKFLF